MREAALEVRVLEADRRGAPLHLACMEERGKRARDVVEGAVPPFLLGLDLLPALPYAAGRTSLGFAEDVRMPADELLVSPSRDLLEIARAVLLQKQRQEVHLEQEVAELVRELRVVSRVSGVCDLVRLLDCVGNDRPRGLLAVPGAVPAEAPCQLLKVEERLRKRHGEDVTGSRSGSRCRSGPEAPEARSRSHS